ncbi:MAG: hypothetical protein FIA98_04005 [Anaerolineae bacterium]|nr:hypothetical protein [Anaerolineae bacterium]
MRPDANQAEIVIALRAAGASVHILAGVGCGCPDILIGWHNHNLLMEIKIPAGRGNRLTEAEIIWISAWQGQVAIVNSIDEALAVLYGSFDESG